MKKNKIKKLRKILQELIEESEKLNCWGGRQDIEEKQISWHIHPQNNICKECGTRNYP